MRRDVGLLGGSPEQVRSVPGWSRRVRLGRERCARMTTLRLHITGLQLPNFANGGVHWRVKAKKVAAIRETVTYHLLATDWSALPKPTVDTPWTVRLSRMGPRLLDDDGVVSACKSARDAIAAFIGVNDRDRHVVRYDYELEPSRLTGPYGLTIEITPRQLEIET